MRSPCVSAHRTRARARRATLDPSKTVTSSEARDDVTREVARFLVFGQRQLQADVGVQVAVRDVMHDLPHGPATVAIWRIELRIVQAFHRGAQFRRCRRDLLDRPLAPHRCHSGRHFEFSNGVARIHRELLLGQPDISLDYRRSNLSGSTLFRTKHLSNLAASIPNRPAGNATIPALLYLAGAVLNLMSGEKSKCITSLSSAVDAPASLLRFTLHART